MDYEFEGMHGGKLQPLRLHGTEREWQLQRQVKRKQSGKEVTTWEPFRFYTSLPHALQAIGQAQHRQANTVEGAVSRLRKLGEILEQEIDALTGAEQGRRRMEGLGEPRAGEPGALATVSHISSNQAGKGG